MAEIRSTDHATHDPLLVAALVDRELSGAELDRARELVASCTACEQLHADLRSLASATRELPTPARPRDFRLSPADVERLRPNVIRRFLGAIGSSRDVFSRPLAMGLTTLGLAGLLFASVPAILPTTGETLNQVGEQIDGDGGEDFGRDTYALSAAPAASPAAAPGAVPGDRVAASSVPEPASLPEGGAGAQEQDQGQERNAAGDASSGGTEIALAPDPTGISTLVVVSGSLLIIGLGLFALRWTARRFGD